MARTGERTDICTLGRGLPIRRFVGEQYLTFWNRGKSLKPNAIADFVSRGATSDSHPPRPRPRPNAVRLALALYRATRSGAANAVGHADGEGRSRQDRERYPYLCLSNGWRSPRATPPSGSSHRFVRLMAFNHSRQWRHGTARASGGPKDPCANQRVCDQIDLQPPKHQPHLTLPQRRQAGAIGTVAKLQAVIT